MERVYDLVMAASIVLTFAICPFTTLTYVLPATSTKIDSGAITGRAVVVVVQSVRKIAATRVLALIWIVIVQVQCW